MYRHLAGATLGAAAAISIGCSDGTGPGLSPLPTQPIVFMRVRSTFSNIVRVNPDGTGETTLTNSGADAYPSWSPDHKRIAYFLLRQEWTDVYVMDADGSNQRVVLRAAAVGVAQNAEPAWSPDQQWLAYPKAFSLVRIRLDGTGERVITDGAAAPSWSPDGQRIALALNGGIAVSNLDGSDRRPVVAPGVDPAWSPDGRRVAYAAGGRSRREFHLHRQCGRYRDPPGYDADDGQYQDHRPISRVVPGWTLDRISARTRVRLTAVLHRFLGHLRHTCGRYRSPQSDDGWQQRTTELVTAGAFNHSPVPPRRASGQPTRAACR